MAKIANHRWRGQSLVEFAFIVPVFFWLMLGTIDLGRVVFLQSLINHAVREGARAGLPMAAGGSPSLFTTLPGEVEQAAGPVASQVTPCVMLVYSDSLLSAPPSCTNGTTSGSTTSVYGYLVVTASVPFQPASGFFVSNWTFTITGQSMMLFQP